MRSQKVSKYFFIIVLIFLSGSVFAQNQKQEKMEQLNFLIGEWVGTSKIFEDTFINTQ